MTQMFANISATLIAGKIDDVVKLTQEAVDGGSGPQEILENGLKNPIHERRDEERYVLVEGLHRLEAVRALGEDTVEALVVSARRH